MADIFTKALGVENFSRLLARLEVINIFAHEIQYPDYTKHNQEARALLLRWSVKMAMQSAPLHQGEVHFANQSSSQLQDYKGIDQTVAENSDLAKEDLMVQIESMPHYDQVLHSMQEMMPRMRGY